MDKLVLFDVDKTLLVSSIGHHAAFSEAFRRVYGIDASINIITHDGLTDKQMIIQVMREKGLDEDAIAAKLEECAQATVKAFGAAVRGIDIVVLDGVTELLAELEKSGVMMGIVTGNLEPIARAKLRKAGLERYFKVGGFGSDDMERPNLVRVAVRRAKDLGLRPGAPVFLLGDTPRDVAAGKDAGVRTVGVATGIYTREQLKAAGADFVLNSLADTAEVLRVLDVR